MGDMQFYDGDRTQGKNAGSGTVRDSVWQASMQTVNWTVCDAKTGDGRVSMVFTDCLGGRCSAGRFYLTVSLLTPILYAAAGAIH